MELFDRLISEFHAEENRSRADRCFHSLLEHGAGYRVLHATLFPFNRDESRLGASARLLPAHAPLDSSGCTGGNSSSDDALRESASLLYAAGSGSLARAAGCEDRFPGEIGNCSSRRCEHDVRKLGQVLDHSAY